MMRPSKVDAEQAVMAFFGEAGINYEKLCEIDGVRLRLYEDGEDGWSFWLHSDDTTSYVHADLKIEWFGTVVEWASRP